MDKSTKFSSQKLIHLSIEKFNLRLEFETGRNRPVNTKKKYASFTSPTLGPLFLTKFTEQSKHIKVETIYSVRKPIRMRPPDFRTTFK